MVILRSWEARCTPRSSWARRLEGTIADFPLGKVSNVKVCRVFIVEFARRLRSRDLTLSLSGLTNCVGHRVLPSDLGVVTNRHQGEDDPHLGAHPTS